MYHFTRSTLRVLFWTEMSLVLLWLGSFLFLGGLVFGFWFLVFLVFFVFALVVQSFETALSAFHNKKKMNVNKYMRIHKR